MIIPASRLPVALALGAFALVLLAAAGLAVGSFAVAPADVARILLSAIDGAPSGVGDNARAVVLDIRAPRVAAALAVGAALGAAGAAFQNVFRNPLVSPDILGVSTGCALGAAVGILAGLPAAAMQGLAFAGGLAAVAIVLAIGAWVRARDRELTLVLTGIVVGSMLGAGVAFAKTVADPYNELPALTFWLMGSFASVRPRDLALAAPLIAAGIAPLVLLRWRVNVIALSDDEVGALGLDARRLRLLVIACATLATSAAVALAGVIAWIGLIVPHAARLLAGPAFARVLPLAAMIGAGFMLAVDLVCRAGPAVELAPGVVTAIVGAPAFIVLLAAAARRAP